MTARCTRGLLSWATPFEARPRGFIGCRRRPRHFVRNQSQFETNVAGFLWVPGFESDRPLYGNAITTADASFGSIAVPQAELTRQVSPSFYKRWRAVNRRCSAGSCRRRGGEDALLSVRTLIHRRGWLYRLLPIEPHRPLLRTQPSPRCSPNGQNRLKNGSALGSQACRPATLGPGVDARACAGISLLQSLRIRSASAGATISVLLKASMERQCRR